MAPQLALVRNIGIAAHVDAGKTTLTERMLYYAGVSHKIGEVHEGAAHMDYLAEEQAHGITISAAVTTLPWRAHLIQLIDTPGHVDFSIEVERSMRVLDACVLVLDGVRGVEPQTEAVWRQRAQFQLPSLFFINKLDRPGADFAQALATIQQRFAVEALALTVPCPAYDGTVIHLIEQTCWRFQGERGAQVQVEPCAAATWEAVRPWRESLLLNLAEQDAALADLVLADQEPDPELLWKVLRQATLAGKVYPCFAGSALRNQGVQALMDGIVRLLPAPTERPPSAAHTLDGGVEMVAMSADEPLAALAFKVQIRDGRRYVFTRIYRGTLQPNAVVAIPDATGTLTKERVTHLFAVDAGQRQRLELASAGQIVLLAGLNKATTGDTLCAPQHPLWLERITAREPVLGLAIEPYSSSDEDKLVEALDKLRQEDPTLRVEEDAETGQRVLRGMGELHLQIAGERLQREFNLRVRVGQPAVVLRETLQQAAQVAYLFQRVIEAADGKKLEMKARVTVEVAPNPRGAGIHIALEPRLQPNGSELTALQRQALHDGISDALAHGASSGAAVEDVRVCISAVELFAAHSSPSALRIAVAEALRRAMLQAGTVLLHPIMATEVLVPESDLGTVLGDLQARQALIRDTSTYGGMAVVHCDCALDHLLGYITALRSMTRGRGQFSMSFKSFDRIA